LPAKKNRVAEVATISAGDPVIGQLIACQEKVGKDGVVTVEEGPGLALEKRSSPKASLGRGYVSPYMVTDTARMEAVYNKPAYLVTESESQFIAGNSCRTRKTTNAGKKRLSNYAEDVAMGMALGTLILNRLKGGI